MPIIKLDELNAGKAYQVMEEASNKWAECEEKEMTCENFQLVSTGTGSVVMYNNQKVVLTAATFLGTTVGGNPTLINGVSVPLANNWVLTASEVAEAQAAVNSFNATIQGGASQYGWAFWDAYAVLNQVVGPGLPMDDFVLTGDLVMGGLFSLDGVHPTARGNAMIAKLMIAAIDAHYGSNLSDVNLDIGDYPTNYPDGL